MTLAAALPFELPVDAPSPWRVGLAAELVRRRLMGPAVVRLRGGRPAAGRIPVDAPCRAAHPFVMQHARSTVGSRRGVAGTATLLGSSAAGSAPPTAGDEVVGGDERVTVWGRADMPVYDAYLTAAKGSPVATLT